MPVVIRGTSLDSFSEHLASSRYYIEPLNPAYLNAECIPGHIPGVLRLPRVCVCVFLMGRQCLPTKTKEFGKHQAPLVTRG